MSAGRGAMEIFENFLFVADNFVAKKTLGVVSRKYRV